MVRRLARRALVAGLLIGTAALARADDAGVRDAGPYRVHYNALPADEIAPAMAERHGLPTTPGHCVVSVAVEHRASGTPVAAMASGEITRPDGRMRPLDLREMRVDDRVYYVAAVPLDGALRLRFELKVSPAGDMPPETIRFSRSFGDR